MKNTTQRKLLRIKCFSESTEVSILFPAVSMENLSNFSKARVLLRFKGGNHFDWTVTM